MANDFVQVPPDSTGKKLQTFLNTIGANNVEAEAQVLVDSTGAEKATAGNPVRIDPTGTTTQPVSAASLPLPAGASTEATLATRLADATFTGRINTQGQKAMAASTPVVLPSDQAAIPVTLTSTTITGTVAENLTQVGGGAVSLGAKTSANSIPVVLASDEATLAVSLASTTITGNVTVVQPTGTNLHAVIDAGSTTSVSNFPAIQSVSQSTVPWVTQNQDESGNKVPFSDWYGIFQMILMELRAIRLGVQYQVSVTEASRGGLNLMETAQEYDEEIAN